MIGVDVTTGWAPADLFIAIATVVGAVALMWDKVIGPFLFKPLSRVVEETIDEIIRKRVTDQLAEVKTLALEANSQSKEAVEQWSGSVDAVAELAGRFDAVEKRMGRLERKVNPQ